MGISDSPRQLVNQLRRASAPAFAKSRLNTPLEAAIACRGVCPRCERVRGRARVLRPLDVGDGVAVGEMPSSMEPILSSTRRGAVRHLLGTARRALRVGVTRQRGGLPSADSAIYRLDLL